MTYEAALTVAQSKRIIARGVRNHPLVKAAYNTGVIAVCKGTTCSYVAEEFLGHDVEPFSYTTGLTLPKEPSPAIEKPKTTLHDVIIRKGDIHTDGETAIDAAFNMNPGDVIIKGANALNYAQGVAGCLIGHPKGGTVGGFWGPLYGRKLHLIIPVGLEKEIAADINEVSRMTMNGHSGNALMPMTGVIVTEIEAIRILTGADAVQLAAGGIRGAEGAVRLLITGEDSEIKAAKQLIQDTADERPF